MLQVIIPNEYTILNISHILYFEMYLHIAYLLNTYLIVLIYSTELVDNSATGT
jgi:hypothetical protein